MKSIYREINDLRWLIKGDFDNFTLRGRPFEGLIDS